MKRIKDWVRIKLKKFLGIKGLEYSLDGFAKSTNKELNELSQYINFTKRDLQNDVSHLQRSVNTLKRTVENVVHIGTDVYENPRHGRSWAVVCVEGRINIVKFVDLNGKDARDILGFLKQFEAGKHCIDTPHRVFFDELFKFD